MTIAVNIKRLSEYLLQSLRETTESLSQIEELYLLIYIVL
jgi:hypothetical protein